MDLENFYLRLIGANILAAIFAPDRETFLADFGLYMFVVLALMALTSPARASREE